MCTSWMKKKISSTLYRSVPWLSKYICSVVRASIDRTRTFSTMNLLMSICVFDAVSQSIQMRCVFFIFPSRYFVFVVVFGVIKICFWSYMSAINIKRGRFMSSSNLIFGSNQKHRHHHWVFAKQLLYKYRETDTLSADSVNFRLVV